MVGVHSPGFEPSQDPEAVEAAVARLGIAYPVVVDAELEIWREYENLGWPARYLFGPNGMLFEYHYGEGAYEETELAIQELLGVRREPVAPVRPEDAPGALLRVQSDDVPAPYSGPYEAGTVWAVLDGAGTVTANGRRVRGRSPRRLQADQPRAQHRGRTGAHGRSRRDAATRSASRPGMLPAPLADRGRLTSAGGPRVVDGRRRTRPGTGASLARKPARVPSSRC